MNNIIQNDTYSSQYLSSTERKLFTSLATVILVCFILLLVACFVFTFYLGKLTKNGASIIEVMNKKSQEKYEEDKKEKKELLEEIQNRKARGYSPQ
jgi:cell division protein FtsB